MYYANRLCLSLLVGGVACLTTARADDLTTTLGKKYSGKLVAVDPSGVTFQTADAKVQVPAKEVQVVDLGNKIVAPGVGVKFVEIELVDGSVVRSSKFAVKGKAFELESLTGPDKLAPPVFTLPMTTVFTVLRGAEDPKNREEWRGMLAARGKRDLYVIRQNGGLDFIRGTALSGNDTGDMLNFEREDGTKTELRLSRATGGLVFNQLVPASVPPTLCKVHDVFGNIWVVQAIEIMGPGMRLTTVSGVTVEYPALAGISKLDYGEGNITYLSDLEPQITAPKFPEDDIRTLVLGDRALCREGLKLDNVPITRGVWANAQYDELILTYTLNGDYKDFKASVGIPIPATAKVAPKEAGIKLTVEVDGRPLFSEVIRPNDKPKPLTLDVNGAKQLRFTIEPLARFQYTQIILAEARVQK